MTELDPTTGVSIHAPVKGATTSTARALQSYCSFNPRAREGRDLALSAALARTQCFNPRAREGRDLSLDLSASIAEVSIHAPVKGATPERWSTTAYLLSFNPRAREGRDKNCERKKLTHKKFQSTRP